MGLISNGGVGLIGFFWVFVGLGFSSLIGDGYVGLIGLFWVFVGLGISSLIDDDGVGLIGYFWVSNAGFDRQWWCGFDWVFLGFWGRI